MGIASKMIRKMAVSEKKDKGEKKKDLDVIADGNTTQDTQGLQESHTGVTIW
jgi:hypothetical protein